MSKHTEGPWKFDDVLGCRSIKGGKSGARKQAQYKEIATTVGLTNDDEDRANARLMATAPDMLELLHYIEHGSAKLMGNVAACLWCQNWPHEENCPVGRVIAKAEGNSNGND